MTSPSEAYHPHNHVNDALRANPLSGKASVIFDEMERRLMSGRYKFGEPISVQELTKEFQSSRQPVTVAINHLRSLGYLIVLPQIGCRVVSPSPQEVSDFFCMLSKVESVIAGMAAERRIENEIDKLERIATQIESITLENTDDLMVLSREVDAFHESIRSMAHSNIMALKAATLWRLADFMMWQGTSDLSRVKIDVANEERRKIIDSIRRSDRAMVESQMEIHILGKPHRAGLG